MRRILKYIILIIPILLIGTGIQASGYRLEVPTMLRDTIIDTDSLSFAGVITNNSLDNIIELISLTSPIIYTSKGDTIIIDEKK